MAVAAVATGDRGRGTTVPEWGRGAAIDGDDVMCRLIYLRGNSIGTDQTRPDQTRPDQTRQTHFNSFRVLKFNELEGHH